MTQRGVLATMQVLDVYGPLEMFACKPAQAHFDVVFVAERAGEVASAQKAVTVAEHDFASCPPLDILLVPGKHELCCTAVCCLLVPLVWPSVLVMPFIAERSPHTCLPHCCALESQQLCCQLPILPRMFEC